MTNDNYENKAMEKCTKHQKINDKLRERSGNFSSKNQLTSFLYIVLRDHLTVSIVEELVRDVEVEFSSEGEKEVVYSNGWLAAYAEDLAKRLTNT